MLCALCALVSAWLLAQTGGPVRPVPDLAEVAARAAPAVVSIRAETPVGLSTGSGFIVDPFGAVVTSLHVVEGAVAVTVKLASGLVYDHVRVRASDARADLAILQLPGFGLPTIPLGDAGSVRAGDAVVLLGSPRGREGGVSTGRVRRTRTTESGLRVIQTDARAEQGSSGGPLLSAEGKALGVLGFRVKGSRKSNSAIPIDHVRRLLRAAGPA